MSILTDKIKEELKKRNSERKSSPLEDWFDICFKQMGIYGYTKEYQVDKYFLDFAWPNIKFAVEADGDLYHFDKKNEDFKRDEILKKQGWIIYRVNSKEAWDFNLFTKHLLEIYFNVAGKRKIHNGKVIEIISNNNPSEYINNWHKRLKDKKEEYISENRIYYCEKCDNFYSRTLNCKCE